MTLSKTGRYFTQEHKKNLSESMMGKNKGRTAWNKGIPQTEEHRKNNSLSHKNKITWMKGKKHTEESKLKIKLGRIGKPCKGMTGKKHSQKTKDQISKSKLGSTPWNKNSTDEIYKEKMRQNRLHQVFPRKDSKPEIFLQQALESEGIKFEKHIPLIGQPDIFIKPNLCIFVDGDYWHSLPKVQNRDILVTERLEKAGYKVIRFSDDEVLNNIHQVVLMIKNEATN